MTVSVPDSYVQTMSMVFEKRLISAVFCISLYQNPKNYYIVLHENVLDSPLDNMGRYDGMKWFRKSCLTSYLCPLVTVKSLSH